MSSDRAIPRDPALPGLEDLVSLTPGGFVHSALSELTTSIPDPNTLLTSYLRYRPGKACVVGWTWLDAEGRTRRASGRLCHNDRSEKLLSGPLISQLAVEIAAALPAGRPYSYFAEKRLLLQQFPFDARLPYLRLAGDSTWVSSRVLDTSGSSIVVTPQSYKPWRRCVYRYDVETQARQTIYFAKLFRDDRGSALLKSQGRVAVTLRNASAPWSIPAPIRYLPDIQALLFEGLEDPAKVRSLFRPAMKSLTTKQLLLDSMMAAARGLASLQLAHIPSAPREAPDDLLMEFRRSCAGLHAVAAELAEMATSALDHAARVAGSLPPEPLVASHGAFRHDQLLMSGDGLVVLDLDTLCLSGASADAGNFLGYLDLTAMRRPRIQPILEEAAEAFQAGLEEAAHTRPEWIAWYRAIAHIKKALRAFFSLAPGWPEMTTRLLQLSHETLYGAHNP